MSKHEQVNIKNMATTCPHSQQHYVLGLAIISSKHRVIVAFVL